MADNGYDISDYHDVDPLFGTLDQLDELIAQLHLHRGTPYVYQGDELGMPNAGFTRLDQLRDVESLNQYATAVARGEDPADVIRALAHKSRDNARVPMTSSCTASNAPAVTPGCWSWQTSRPKLMWSRTCPS